MVDGRYHKKDSIEIDERDELLMWNQDVGRDWYH